MSANHHTVRLSNHARCEEALFAPCRWLDGHVKEPYEMSLAWEPDRRSNFFFSPPAHPFAITYMIVTLSNQYSLVHSWRGPFESWLHILPNFGGFHRTLQRVRLANRGRLLLRTPGPVPFGTCICSNVETILSWTCHVYGPFEFRTSLGSSILLLLEYMKSQLLFRHSPARVPSHIGLGIHVFEDFTSY